MGPTVRSSVPALLILGALWLGLPGFFLLDTTVLHTSAGTDSRTDVVVFGVIALLGALNYWRLARRRCVRLADGSGLLVTSYWRRNIVFWDELEAVESEEARGTGNGFNLSLTHLMFPGAGGPGLVAVSATCRSGSAGAYTIRTWLPPGHRLRADLPAGLRDATGPPVHDPEAEARVRASPITASLRPHRGVVALTVGLALLPAGVFGSLAVESFRSDPPAVAAAVCSLSAALAAASVAIAGRALRGRLDLTSAGLIDHGPLGSRVLPVAEISSIDVESAQSGKNVFVTLVGRGSRKLFAGSGYGDHAVGVKSTLDAWLAGTRGSP